MSHLRDPRLCKASSRTVRCAWKDRQYLRWLAYYEPSLSFSRLVVTRLLHAFTMPWRIRLFEFRLLCGQRFLFALFASRTDSARSPPSLRVRTKLFSATFSSEKAISRVHFRWRRNKEKGKGLTARKMVGKMARGLNFVKPVAALDSKLSNGFCPVACYTETLLPSTGRRRSCG